MVKPVALDAARVSDIARQIRGAVTPVLGPQAERADAKELLTAASQAEVSCREGIMVNLASLSQVGQWTTQEIGAAAGKAAAMTNNETEKALATFIGETKRAMHPSVRAHVPGLIQLREMVWTAETEQRKADRDAPTPLRKAFSRSYHLLIAMFGEAAEGRVFVTAQHVLDFASERDPDLDLDKVTKRLAGIRDMLVKFYADWPVDDIQVCVDALNEVDKKALKASRGDVVAEKPVPTTVVAQITPDVEDDTSEEFEETEQRDILEDVLAAI